MTSGGCDRDDTDKTYSQLQKELALAGEFSDKIDAELNCTRELNDSLERELATIRPLLQDNNDRIIKLEKENLAHAIRLHEEKKKASVTRILEGAEIWIPPSVHVCDKCDNLLRMRYTEWTPSGDPLRGGAVVFCSSERPGKYHEALATRSATDKIAKWAGIGPKEES